MKYKIKFSVMIILYLVFIFLTGCGNWDKKVELKVFDYTISERISLPITFDYGFFGEYTSVVSNDDLSEIGKKIDSIYINDRKCSFESFGDTLVVFIPVKDDKYSVMLLKQVELKIRDSTLNKFKYCYLFKDLYIRIHEGNFLIAFPSHLITNIDKGEVALFYVSEKETYETNFTFDDFVEFYKEYTECYGIQPESDYEIFDGKIILKPGGNLIHSFDDNEIEKGVEISFISEDNKNKVAIKIIDSTGTEDN